MSIFSKKNTTTQIPELQEFYSTQNKQSTSVAWLLAFTSLFITAAVFVGLFSGGRWVYRKLNNKNSNSVATVQVAGSDNATNNDGNVIKVEQPTAKVSVPVVETSISGYITPAQGVSPSQTDAINKKAVSAATNVPNTGPGLSAGLFALVTIIGFCSYRKILISKN